jgi:MoaA/NifB/PqqE/SkfB family radical SAM enzyme
MVDEVGSHGAGRTQYIRYTSNGEPLIHPNSYDMIEDACRRSGVYVTLTTNGTIMNEKRTRRLLEAGVHMIDVSLDAFEPETYAKIRVHGDLRVTRENVLRLIRWVKEMKARTRVVVSFVEQPCNTGEIEPFRSYWEEQGADFVLIRRLHSSAGAVVSIAQTLRERATGADRYPCLYPWERVVLDPSGFLHFCPVDWSHGSRVADYRSTTIRETWKSAFYAALREAHLTGDFSCHSFCGQCPDWQQTRWPSQGASYADVVDVLKKR